MATNKNNKNSTADPAADLASLIRVRNRLAQQIPLEDFDRFCHVITGLLPRLLQRLDTNTNALSKSNGKDEDDEDNDNNNNNNRNNEIPSNNKDLMKASLYSQIQSHLTGILSHILERIRLMESRFQNQHDEQQQQQRSPSFSRGVVGSTPRRLLPSPVPWIESIGVVLPEMETSLAQTMALTLLQAGFTLRHLWRRQEQDKQQHNRHKEINTANISSVTTTTVLLKGLQDFQDQVYTKLWQLEKQQFVGLYQPPNARERHELIVEQQRRRRRPSQRGLEQLRRHQPPVLNRNAGFREAAWEEEEVNGDDVMQTEEEGEGVVVEARETATESPHMTREKLERQVQLTQSQHRMVGWLILDEVLLSTRTVHKSLPTSFMGLCSTAEGRKHNVNNKAATTVGFGTYNLFVDFVLFRPNNQETTRVQDVQGSTGLSRYGLQRLQMKLPNHANTASLSSVSLSSRGHSSTAFFQLWKARVMDYALRTIEPSQALVLAVITSGTETLHAQTATAWLDEYEESQLQRNTSTAACSLPEILALFILILGQDRAGGVFEETVAAEMSDNKISDDALREAWADRVGWNQILGSTPTTHPRTSSTLTRLPLHPSLAARAVSYLQKHLSVSLLLELQQEQACSSAAQISSSFIPRLVFRLVAELRRLNVYWALQLAHALVATNPDKQATAGKGAGPAPAITTTSVLSFFELKEDWKTEFYDQSLEIAQSVLFVIPNTAAQHAEAGLLIQPGEPADAAPLGVPQAPHRRADLGRLLAQHRVGQQLQHLQSHHSRGARKLAYGIIAKLGRQAITSSSSLSSSSRLFDLTKLVFQCAAFEEFEPLQDTVKKTLDVFLSIFQDFMSHIAGDSKKEAFLAPLLPSLLCAATAERPSAMALHSVVQWCETILASADPAAAFHICSFLSDDSAADCHDENVLRAAKRVCRGLRRERNQREEDTDEEHRFSRVKGAESRLSPCIYFIDLSDPTAIQRIEEKLRERVKKVRQVSSSLTEEASMLLCLPIILTLKS